jgi:hypothetical protein
VALESLGPDNLARAGYFESFGGGTIGPDLGHYGYPPLTHIFWRTKKHAGRATQTQAQPREKATHNKPGERPSFHPSKHKNNSLFRT